MTRGKIAEELAGWLMGQGDYNCEDYQAQPPARCVLNMAGSRESKYLQIEQLGFNRFSCIAREHGWDTFYLQLCITGLSAVGLADLMRCFLPQSSQTAAHQPGRKRCILPCGDYTRAIFTPQRRLRMEHAFR